MKIHVEHYGSRIGVDGNISQVLSKKEVQLLLTIKSDDDRERLEFVLNKEEATTLTGKINACLNDPVLAENGFKVV